MKLTKEQKTKIHNKAGCGDYEVLKFSCYTDGIFSYYINITHGVKLEISIIPFNNLECFLSDEELGRLLKIDLLFFDCNVYTSNPLTWETEKEDIILLNLDTNNSN